MNVFDLFAKLTLDSSDYDKGLEDAEGKGKSFASGLGKALGGAAKAVAGASIAAVGAAATGITSITTQAVQAYGSYEQLVGGVSKIFGESADQVIANAQMAYTTAGMSANQYMETVTSFSASLIQSLGGDTVKAAEYANMAIADMSDNANTFGTDISSIQNAYQGFAKQNYTMLDNLKLGYGGTKSEMERLIEDAAALSDEFSVQYDEAGNLVYGYGDIVQAIHIVQENMQITGTTAKEASDTIQGTAGSLQAAWENLIIGLGDANADLGPLIDNVVQSALQMVNNIKPIAMQAVKGISDLIKGFAPVLAEELPPLIEEILPVLVDAIVMLVNSLSGVLPTLVGTILPPLINAVTGVIMSILQALPVLLQVLSQQLPVILQQVIPAILTLLPLLVQTGIEFLLAIGSGLADNIDLLMDAVMQIIHYLVDELLTADNIAAFIGVSTEIILTIAEGIIENIPEILGAIMVLIANILAGLWKSLPLIWDAIMNFVVGLGDDLGETLTEWFGDETAQIFAAFDEWWAGVQQFWADIGDSISQGFDNAIQAIAKWGSDIWDNLTSIWDEAVSIVSGAIDNLLNLFNFDWKLPDLKLPHFTVTGEFNLDPTNFSIPSIGVEWYAKAMNTPYLLENASIFGAAGGKLLGAGEKGSEIVYGHDQLMADIATVVDSRLANLEFVVPVYIGGKKIDQQIVTSNAHNSVISGGR